MHALYQVAERRDIRVEVAAGWRRAAEFDGRTDCRSKLAAKKPLIQRVPTQASRIAPRIQNGDICAPPPSVIHRILPVVLSLFSPLASAQEFRAMWADTFHDGLDNSTETTALIAAARAAKCNAVIVEIRRRGDAWYRNGLEPVSTNVAAGFDPLADLIAKGHNTSGGKQRIQIHAWIVTYNIWNNETSPPTQPTHPFNLHADWLNETNTGKKWTGNPGASGNYLFDPGHPGVQRHTFNVAMDIISRYDVDGFHFDYIRYPEQLSSGGNQPWGYNPVSVARFNKLKNRTGTPSVTSSTWTQWRREQVTALVRKVYLKTWALKPQVRISAALIPWGSVPTGATWTNSEAYSRVLQDWRGWMEEGILDLACPMIYRDEGTTAGFDGWADFAKDHQYNRAAAMGMGWYLNTVPNTLTQIGIARSLSPGGKTGAGIVGYSYAVPNDDGTGQSGMWSQLASGPFSSTATVPAMPWKTSATIGHAMGTVSAADNGDEMDGATVNITGPTNRTLITDATGFWGAVDLPVGSYTLTVSLPGFRTLTRTFAVTGGAVAQPATQLEIVPFQITSVVRNMAGTTLTITWDSVPDRSYRVEQSTDAKAWTPAASGITATAASTSHVWAIPAGWQSRAFLRVAQEP
jgi:uncharacterized lipoprotein YddW (UPF0748 family)